MTSLGQELVGNADAIVQRWYDAWRESSHPHDDVAEAALKDKLPQQLRLIGEQLEELARADAVADVEKTAETSRIAEQSDPGVRVEQDVPIQDVVQQYRIVVDTVRTWIEERGIDVPFAEYSYFYSAIFELAAESVRRYSQHEAQRIREDRAAYLAGVMHQLRTPVSVLATGVEVLDRAGREALAATVPRLRRNVRRINVLVESILRLERYEPGDIPVHPESVRPAHVIDEIISDYEAEALRKGLRFEAHVDRSLHMTVDPNLLVDALSNLVHNAVRYTHHGYVIIDAEEHRNHVVFCVRDSGPGMGPQKLRGLFRDTGGAGIGLRVAQHAAQAQGGTIDVRSEPGRGSVFTLRLPRVAASDEPHPHDVS